MALKLVFSKTTKRYDRYEVVDDDEKIVGTVYLPSDYKEDELTFKIIKPE